MKKSVFSFLGGSFISVGALCAQTNMITPSATPAAPVTSTLTALTPPPDTAPTTSTTQVSVPTPTVAPTPTAPPVVVSHSVTVHAPVQSSTYGAPARAVATAKPYPPHLYHLTRISWIVATRNNLDVDDRYVTIVGRVTRRIGDDEYWFSDGTASVRLDSEDFDLPIGRKLIVGGRIDQAWLGFGHLEVDVRRWRYAD